LRAEERTGLEKGLKKMRFIIQTGKRPSKPEVDDELQTTVPVGRVVVSPYTKYE
jgi:hypothetical protein